MGIDVILDMLGVSAVLSIFLVVGIAAIIYVFIKKKKDSDYDEAGIPKMVDDLKRTEGSSNAELEETEAKSYEPKVLKGPDE